MQSLKLRSCFKEIYNNGEYYNQIESDIRIGRCTEFIFIKNSSMQNSVLAFFDALSFYFSTRRENNKAADS